MSNAITNPRTIVQNIMKIMNDENEPSSLKLENNKLKKEIKYLQRVEIQHKKLVGTYMLEELRWKKENEKLKKDYLRCKKKKDKKCSNCKYDGGSYCERCGVFNGDD